MPLSYIYISPHISREVLEGMGVVLTTQPETDAKRSGILSHERPGSEITSGSSTCGRKDSYYVPVWKLHGTGAFLAGAIAGQPSIFPLISIFWRCDKSVWVEQWLLNKEKLEAAQTLVLEQLTTEYIVPLTSPWNTTVFVIKQKYGKWCLLQDLRALNKTVNIMGATQLELPTPIAIPKNWYLIIIDLKNCFFIIPLHPA